MSDDRKPHEIRGDVVAALDDYLKLAEEWRIADQAEGDLRRNLGASEERCAAARKRMWAAKAVLDSLLTAEATR